MMSMTFYAHKIKCKEKKYKGNMQCYHSDAIEEQQITGNVMGNLQRDVCTLLWAGKEKKSDKQEFILFYFIEA